MALAHPLAFGARLKHERLARGLTQEALADALQLSAEARSRMEAALHRASGAGALVAPELASSSNPADIPLAGRAHERARLAQHLAGEGPLLLLLAGESGIGKSRLRRETAQQAVVDGWTVLAGGCDRRSGQEPYTPLLDAITGYLLRQPPVQTRSALAQSSGNLAALRPAQAGCSA